VVCWGDEEAPTHPSLVSGVSRATQLELSAYGGCALARDRIWCWDLPELTGVEEGAGEVVALRGAVELAMGDRHVCGRFADGTVRCALGDTDDVGVLGQGDVDAREEDEDGRLPAAVVTGIADAQSIAAAGEHTCVARADGTVWCWGHSQEGAIGDGSRAVVSRPVLTFPAVD
jgi:hypothetical protein